MIEGLSHLTLSVLDLDRSYAFYRDVLGLRPLARWPSGAYLLAGESTWICLTADAAARKAPLAEYTHVAFSVPAERFAEACARVRASGAREWKTNTSEGASIYFLDPDGHKLELHVGDWNSRLEAWRESPPSGLELFPGPDVARGSEGDPKQ